MSWARRDGFMPHDAGNDDQLHECFARLARRAFRRPVSSAEVDGFVKIVKADLAAGDKFLTQ